MDIQGSVAFVSGSSRGIGRAYVNGLLARGVAKVYAGARDTNAIANFVRFSILPKRINPANDLMTKYNREIGGRCPSFNLIQLSMAYPAS